MGHTGAIRKTPNDAIRKTLNQRCSRPISAPLTVVRIRKNNYLHGCGCTYHAVFDQTFSMKLTFTARCLVTNPMHQLCVVLSEHIGVGRSLGKDDMKRLFKPFSAYPLMMVRV